jgi:hypothetical protein
LTGADVLGLLVFAIIMIAAGLLAASIFRVKKL